MANEVRVMTTMEIIRENLGKPHKAGLADQEFSSAIYTLFREYSDTYYRNEWQRLDDNETIYQGDPNGKADADNPNAPEPSTPIITSTIENIKADLSDEFPCAIITNDVQGQEGEVLSKVMTAVIEQELEACSYDYEYDALIHDLLVGGWMVSEVGYDPYANSGVGGAYIRHIINKNFMCDPKTTNIQDGRACFKIDRKPKDWFLQHYPEQYPYMADDTNLIGKDHDYFDATTIDTQENDQRLIEAWFRVFDPVTRKHKVHFVLVSGGQILEDSAITRPDGYFKHGKYPFIITRLYPQKGSALGLGVADLFKQTQRYSDKLDQILLHNAFRASKPRIFYQEGTVDPDDFLDMDKEAIAVQGSPRDVMQWQQPQPLPSYIPNYIEIMRQSIKDESGANDQARGNTSSAITAASAITALQEMSLKRSRMHARAVHYGFKNCIKMLLEVIRDNTLVKRNIQITMQGNPMIIAFDGKSMFKNMDQNSTPIDFMVSVKTARETKYTTLSNNELVLQMTNLLNGQVDPAIMLEGLQFSGKEHLLDTVKRAQQGGMLMLQNQVQQMAEALNAQATELEELRQLKAQVQGTFYRQQSNDSNPDKQKALAAEQELKNQKTDMMDSSLARQMI